MFDVIIIAILTAIWLSYFPIAIVSIIRLLQNRNVFLEQDLRRIHNDPRIIFQITTRSATKTPVVKRGIASVIDSARAVGYDDYEISITTDDPADRDTLRKDACEVILVEKSFKTSAIKKGRALQYAVERRRKTRKNTSKYWIFHMDDESYVTPQTVLALLKFIRQGRGLASEGPIFYPLKFELANRLTAIAESIRPYSCYDCVSQMTNPPPLHMHGSNLLARSDVEDAVGWDFGPTLAEDQLFGYKIYEKYGASAMGWHGGMLLEQPPLTVKDHFFQRRRWVIGTLQNIHHFPPWHKRKLIFKSITYFLGFVSAVASSILSAYIYYPQILSLTSLYNMNFRFGEEIIASFSSRMAEVFSYESIMRSLATFSPVEVTIGAVLLFTWIVWLMSYQLGLFLNLRYSGIRWARRISLHIQTLILCPLVGLIETFPAFYSVIEYYFRKKRNNHKVPVYDFYVIRK
ncbi:MAG: glycosyltransferase family 2 protein [Nitrososphaera sp.]